MIAHPITKQGQLQFTSAIRDNITTWHGLRANPEAFQLLSLDTAIQLWFRLKSALIANVHVFIQNEMFTICLQLYSPLLLHSNLGQHFQVAKIDFDFNLESLDDKLKFGLL